MASTVCVIDDDTPVRRSLERLLRSAGFDVETFVSARAFLDTGAVDEAGCIVLDVQMPTMSGLELQDWLNDLGAYHPPIIFISGHASVPATVHALKHGAEDFLEKPIEAEALFGAIQRALARDRENRIARQELQVIHDRFDSLSAREREVLGHVIAGKLNKQIAGELGISEKTVKAHRGRLMEKMQVRSVAELVGQMYRIHVPAAASPDNSTLDR